MYLKGKRCYLAGPIEADVTTHNWRTDPKRVLKEEFEIDLFDPHEDPKEQWVPHIVTCREAKDYDGMTRIARDFVRKDLSVVDRSDFIIACLPYRVPTTGTVHEIVNSSNAKKPTMIVCPEGKEKVPIWYYGFIDHNFMFGSWEDLYTYLREVNDGKHRDERRWSYVYGLI